MIKRILFIVFLGVFLIGCKAKHKVSYGKDYDETAYNAERNRTKEDNTPKTWAERRRARGLGRKKKKKAEPEKVIVKKVIAMPVDTGKFIEMKFASPQDYISTFYEMAQLEMATYGIPASITLAQGLLESGNGKSKLARATNNHFGIKCHRGWKGEYDFFDDDEIGECFRKYNHPMFSYRDHSLFLYGRKRYAFLFDFEITDYKKWAYGLKKAGYATDKKYPQKLIRIVELYGLDQFDIGDGNTEYIEKRKEKEVTVVKNPIPHDGYTKPRAKNYDKRDEFRVERKLKTHEFDKNKPTTTTTEVNKANQTKSLPVQYSEYKTHLVKKGDTLYSLSKKYAVSVDDLKRWNYMNGEILSVGQEITVKTKK
jgi:flagellum-specific peptidoglycan hydrolase FlgJ